MAQCNIYNTDLHETFPLKSLLKNRKRNNFV